MSPSLFANPTRLLVVTWLLILFGTCAMAADSPDKVVATPKIPQVAEKAPDFSLNALDGTAVTLSKLTAVSPVVLVVLRGYPGYQCPICAYQVAGLIAQESELSAANAHVVLVYPGASENLATKAKEFWKMRDLIFAKLPGNFSYVIDPGYQFTLAYGLRWDAPKETAYPATFVIDRQGVVRYVKVSRTHGNRAPVADILKVLADIR